MKYILSLNPLRLILSGTMLLSSIVKAQNIPNGSTYPTGTATVLSPANFVSGVKVNSIRSIAPNIPVLDEASIHPLLSNESKVTTSYSDGLGRPIETVNHFASPTQKDMVTVVKYDNFGREAWHFLPYAKGEATAADNGKFKLTAFTDQKNFYKTDMGFTVDNYFYTQSNYEPSPLNRVIKTLPQGNSWVGSNRGKTITEYPLQASSGLRMFTIGYTPGSLPVASGTYAAGDLMVKVVTDEDGNFIQEYTDKDNFVVIKNAGKTGSSQTIMTYYVYDDFGLLRFVIPPKATVWLANNNWAMTPAIASELCFNYQYDDRLRMISKNTPGQGTQYLVYNIKDELILTQTPTQAAKGEYIFNKYDVLGRLIQTGVYNNTTAAANLQTLANTSNAGTDAFLAYLFNDVYGNTAYVTSFTNAKVLLTNYYDDYSFTTRAYDGTFMSSLPTGWNTTVTQETTNLLTGTKVVVLDGATTPTELIAVNFYNDRGLLLQTQALNHMGGWSFVTTSYDFLGQKLGVYSELNNPQAANNAKIKTIETFSYNQAGNVTSSTHSLNNLGVVTSTYNFDELQRLANKKFPNSINPSIVYDYNIHGWISGINKNYCLTGTGDQSFGMEINYDYGYGTNYFNGSVAGVKWRNLGKTTQLRSYGYVYDAYNRLKSADFVMKTGAINSAVPFSNTTIDFTASNMLYDENGNIQSMKHMGLNVGGQKIILDDLSYGYATNTNKLLSVTESASSQSKNPTTYDKLGDFRDVAGANDYTYDANGNLLTDANKSLTFIYDEVVNKTARVTKGQQSVIYLYDAAGNKLQKKVTSPAVGAPITTDYLGSAVYGNNSLSFISHSEGRIRYDASSPTPYMYDYFIKDHLGSTRSVITYTGGPITGFAKSDATPSNEVKYIATSEMENASKENQLFDNVDNTRAINPNKKADTDKYVARISAKNSKTILGPDITLRVMCGDQVKITAEALYIAEKGNPNEVVQNAITSFIGAFTTLPSLAAEGISTATSNSTNLAQAILNIQKNNTVNGAPKAFLNYVLYDEYMNLIPAGSGALQIKNKESWQTLETDKITIPQNGFLRVFSSNMEAAPVNVNNTAVAIVTGQLVEEYNYYPYGLVFDQTQASTSIKKTNYLYNGKELQHDEFNPGNGLELEDYGARMYDPQTGRWTTPDDFGEIAYAETPYCYVGNNPISRIDPDGNTWLDELAGLVIGTVTNVIPGTTGARNLYTPAEADAYNSALRTADNSAMAVGIAATNFGKGAMATGGVVAAGGGTLVLTGVGAPVGAPIAIAGTAVASTGAATAVVGSTLVLNSTANQQAGYNYGKIYKVPGSSTPSGKPYVGRTKQKTPEKRGKSGKPDGRNRADAEVVDTYDPNNKGEGAYKEQKQIDKSGGVDNLDNKRNEVKPEKMKELEKTYGNK
jgi:RHS repeat-associated protein